MPSFVPCLSMTGMSLGCPHIREEDDRDRSRAELLQEAQPRSAGLLTQDRDFCLKPMKWGVVCICYTAVLGSS